MRYPVEETAERHARILDGAARLFRQRGFAGVNVGEIMRAAGLTHGAFYAHFDSKDALCACASAHALAEMINHIDNALGAPEPRRAFAEGYLCADHRDHPERGCAVAALGGEVARQPAAARGAFTAVIRTVFARMAEGFTWSRRRPARGQAIRLFATLVGCLVLARAVDDPALADEILAAGRADATARQPAR